MLRYAPLRLDLFLASLPLCGACSGKLPLSDITEIELFAPLVLYQSTTISRSLSVTMFAMATGVVVFVLSLTYPPPPKAP